MSDDGTNSFAKILLSTDNETFEGSRGDRKSGRWKYLKNDLTKRLDGISILSGEGEAE